MSFYITFNTDNVRGKLILYFEIIEVKSQI
jgi:hypothetical protein